MEFSNGRALLCQGHGPFKGIAPRNGRARARDRARPISCRYDPSELASESSPAWWAPDGFAAIPTTTIDPPHCAASPVVPALLGPGPPLELS